MAGSLLPAGVDKSSAPLLRALLKYREDMRFRLFMINRKLSAKTRIIVGADGADSCLRKLISKDGNFPEKYISVQEWFEYPCHIRISQQYLMKKSAIFIHGSYPRKTVWYRVGPEA
jgi:hypothetical protein